MSLLEEAIQIAVEAHRGKKDRYGAPHILHVLRVMLRVHAEEEQIVAVLHDVVEDTALTLDELRARGFAETILSAIDCLTRRPGEPYEDLIERAKSNPIACRVKLADLEDNLDLRRLDTVTAKDAERLNRYLKAWRLLRSQV